MDVENVRLGVPGPVTLHPRVLRALSKPVYYHRTPEFRSVYRETLELYNRIIGSSRGLTTAIMGTGTAAMEAAVAYMVDPETPVVSLVNGKFSERLAEIARRHSKDVRVVEYPRGKAAKPEDLDKALEGLSGAVVTLTHNETSTGVLNPLPEIIKVAHEHDAYVIADGITSVGGDYVFFDDRGIDVLISGSQKCLGMPPGLSFVTLSERARERVKRIYRERGKPYYVDLVKHVEAATRSDTPYTASVSLIYAAREALSMILEEGLEERISRHRRVGETFRKAFPLLGLRLFAEPGYYSNTVTAALPPEGVPAEAIRGKMLEKGVIIAGGQARLKGKIIRVSHMNLTSLREAVMILGLLDLSLRELGGSHEPGRRMEAVYEVRLRFFFDRDGPSMSALIAMLRDYLPYFAIALISSPVALLLEEKYKLRLSGLVSVSAFSAAAYRLFSYVPQIAIIAFIATAYASSISVMPRSSQSIRVAYAIAYASVFAVILYMFTLLVG